MVATPLALVRAILESEFAPTMEKKTGLPTATVTLLKVAVKVMTLPCAGLGDTLAGERTSAGDGLVGTKPQPPELGASFRIVSWEFTYMHPSGPTTPGSTRPLARTVAARVPRSMILSEPPAPPALPPLCTISDLAAPFACT